LKHLTIKFFPHTFNVNKIITIIKIISKIKISEENYQTKLNFGFLILISPFQINIVYEARQKMKNKMVPDVEWIIRKYATGVTFSRYTSNFINVVSDFQLEDLLLIKERNVFWGHNQEKFESG
jgi:hypothetical protein